MENETTQKTRDKILELISNNPAITREEISELTGITSDGVKYHIRNLKSEGILERVGGDKGGHWIVKEKQ